MYPAWFSFELRLTSNQSTLKQVTMSRTCFTRWQTSNIAICHHSYLTSCHLSPNTLKTLFFICHSSPNNFVKFMNKVCSQTMVGSYLVPYAVCSSSSLLLRALLACYQNSTPRRSIQTGRDKHGEKVFSNERAASTAEEFLKIAEEKAEQGISSEGAEKDSDNIIMEKATMGDTGGDIETDKERLKPGVEDESFNKTPK